MNCAHLDWPDDSAYFKAFFRRAERERVPLAGMIELTRRCNLRCVHCYLGPQERAHAERLREMTTAQALMILDQVAAAGCLSLTITGGDPLLRADFTEVYRQAKLAGLDVTVFTNGTPVTDELVALWQDLPPRLVEITLYGATQATYERITRTPGSYRRCLEGIERLHSGGIRLAVKTMLMTANSHEFEAIAGMALRYGKFRFDPVVNACLDGECAPLNLRLDPREAVRLEFGQARRRQEWCDFHARVGALAPSDQLYLCGAGQSGFHIDAYGNLQPCLMLPGISFSLLGGSFAEGWAQMAATRQAKVRPGNRCAACSLRAYCAYCPGLLALENGDPETPSDYLCQLGAERLLMIETLREGTV